MKLTLCKELYELNLKSEIQYSQQANKTIWLDNLIVRAVKVTYLV